MLAKLPSSVKKLRFSDDKGLIQGYREDSAPRFVKACGPTTSLNLSSSSLGQGLLPHASGEDNRDLRPEIIWLNQTTGEGHGWEVV